MASGALGTPEEKARNGLLDTCLQACHQFIRDKPETSLEAGCRILEDDLFMGRGPVSCTVAEGQDKFPTYDVWIRETLTSAPNLRIHSTKVNFYRAFLEEDKAALKEFDTRIKDGSILVVDPPKPVTYESFRRKYPDRKVAIHEFMDTVAPEIDFEKVIADVVDICTMTPPTATRSISVKEELRRHVPRDIDAKKMTDDIMVTIPQCKIRTED